MTLLQVSGALRRPLRSPTWWAMVGLLSLAIAASAGIVVIYRASVVNVVPGHQPSELYTFGGLATGMDDPLGWWGKAPGLSHLILLRTGDAELKRQTERTWVRVTEVSGDPMALFGLSPRAGRSIGREDEFNDRRVALVSSSFWRRLGLGREFVSEALLSLGPQQYIVVGIAPDTFTFPSATDIWIPRPQTEGLRLPLVEGTSTLPPIRSRTTWIGRSRPGIGASQLREQFLAILRYSNETLSAKTGVKYGEIISVVQLDEAIAGRARPQLTVLVVAAGLLLALSLVTFGVFSITRAVENRAESALRLVLGASGGRRLLEMSSEALLLTVVCFFGSVAISMAVFEVGRWALIPGRIALPPTVELISAVLLPAAGVAALVGFVGLIPRCVVDLKLDSGASSALGAHRTSTGVATTVRRSGVFITSMTTTVLIAGAIAANVAFVRLLLQPLGYSSEEIVQTRLVFERRLLRGEAFRTKRLEIESQLRERGIQAAFASVLPVTVSQRGFAELSTDSKRLLASSVEVDGPYFEMLKILPVGGTAELPPTDDWVILNETLAAALFEDLNRAVGAQIRSGGRFVTVRGIVPDSRAVDQGPRRVPEFYRPFSVIDSTLPNGAATFEVLSRCYQRCDALQLDTVGILQEVVGAAVLRSEFVDRSVSAARAREETAAAIWSGFAILAVLVAAAGSIALVTHSITRRRVEIAIRTALGATPAKVVKTLVSEAVLTTALGALAGAAVARNIALAARTVVVGLEPPSWWMLASVSSFLAVLSFVVAAIPATRAARRGAVASLAQFNG